MKLKDAGIKMDELKQTMIDLTDELYEFYQKSMKKYGDVKVEDIRLSDEFTDADIELTEKVFKRAGFTACMDGVVKIVLAKANKIKEAREKANNG